MPRVKLTLNLNEPAYAPGTFPIVEMIEAMDDFIAYLRSAEYGAPLEFAGTAFTPFGTVDWNYEVEDNGEDESPAGADSPRGLAPVEGVDGVRDGGGHANAEASAESSERQRPDEAGRNDGQEGD